MTRHHRWRPGGLHYNAPYFDSTDPEERNNRQLTGSVSHLLSSRRAGTHEVKGGFEYFVSTRVGGNSQTSTGYVFQTDYRVGANGQPELDANGALIPRFTPGVSRVQVCQPTRGATIDLTTASLFVTDHWVAAPRLTFDLGLRFEAVSTEATGGISTVDVTTLVPRLAAAFDLTGDGRTILQGTYGHYAGKYNDAQFSRDSSVGNPDRYVMRHGPPLTPRVRRRLSSRNYTTTVSGTSRPPTCSSRTMMPVALTKASRWSGAEIGIRDLPRPYAIVRHQFLEDSHRRLRPHHYFAERAARPATHVTRTHLEAGLSGWRIIGGYRLSPLSR